MNPDPRRVRALSGHLSEAERMWQGLPSRTSMRPHLDALQGILSRMLEDPVEPKEPAPLATPTDIGPGEGAPDLELEAALERLGRPPALIIEQICDVAEMELGRWLRCHRKDVSRRLAGCGYEKVEKPRASRGTWNINGRNAVVYALRELAIEDRIDAANALAIASRSRGGQAKNLGGVSRKPARSSKSTQRPFSPSDPSPTVPGPKGQGQ